jgi:hypothetical protein
MGKAGSTRGDEKCKHDFNRKHVKKRSLGRLRLTERIILKRIFKK